MLNAPVLTHHMEGNVSSSLMFLWQLPYGSRTSHSSCSRSHLVHARSIHPAHARLSARLASSARALPSPLRPTLNFFLTFRRVISVSLLIFCLVGLLLRNNWQLPKFYFLTRPSRV